MKNELHGIEGEYSENITIDDKKTSGWLFKGGSQHYLVEISVNII